MSIRPSSISCVEAVAVAVDAEGVGQGEGDLAPGLARDLDRPHHRVARRLRVPQIAFEIEDRGVARSAPRRARSRGRCCAAPRKVFIVRCPSGVTRIIERAVGAPTSAARRDELDPGRGQVVPVEFAELVGRDLADEAGAAAERRDARGRVAGRAAADLARRAHVRVEPLGLLGVDQPHRPLVRPFARQESVGRRRRSRRRWHCRCTARRGGGRACRYSGNEGKRARLAARSAELATLPRRAWRGHRQRMRRFTRPRLCSSPPPAPPRPQPAPSPAAVTPVSRSRQSAAASSA